MSSTSIAGAEIRIAARQTVRLSKVDVGYKPLVINRDRPNLTTQKNLSKPTFLIQNRAIE